MAMQNNIGEARRSYALSIGEEVTQDRAATFFGVSPSGYKKWEQGQGKLNGEILCAIADKYGCSVDYLLCRTDDPRPYPSHADIRYKDPRQAAVNGYYESMGEDGRETLLKVARGLGKDGANRIEKDGTERLEDSPAMVA